MRRVMVAAAFSLLALAGPSPAHAQLSIRAIEMEGPRSSRSEDRSGQLLNGDFSTHVVQPWALYSPDGQSSLRVVDEQLVVSIGGLGPAKAVQDIQLLQKNLFLDGDATYALRFDAKSSLGSNLRVRVLQHGAPYENYGLRINQNILTYMTTFELIFATTPGVKRDARLSFLFTEFAQPGEVYTFDNISLEKLDECGDGAVTGDEACDSGAGPLVADGGFEVGSTGQPWSGTSTNFVTPLCNAAVCDVAGAFEGEWWSWFGGVPVPEEGAVSQTITLPEVTAATLNFRVWAPTCSGKSTDFFEVTVDGVPIFGFDLTDPRCASPGYEPVTLDLSALAGSTFELAFRAITGTAGTVGNIFLDAVSIDVDGCRADCTFCGDGTTNGYESCDDGNFINNDGCTSECLSEGAIVLEPGGFSPEKGRRR